jgi:hypothetical protein
MSNNSRASRMRDSILTMRRSKTEIVKLTNQVFMTNSIPNCFIAAGLLKKLWMIAITGS